jgi:hypothetical protein
VPARLSELWLMQPPRTETFDMRNRFFILAAAVMPFAAASGQSLAAPHNVLSIQPINAVFTAYSGEFERQMGGASTVGIGGTFFDVGDGIDKVTFKSGDVKLRYYPNGTALMGFSFGGSAGYTSITGTDASTNNETTVSGPSLGVLLEYQWLMGVQRNMSVALGAGAKAVFVKDADFSSNNYAARYPTVRVSIGYAF